MIVVALLFLISVALTLLIKKMALKHAVIDLPNERSSHDVPTPRGGGIAIIVAFFIGISYLFFRDAIAFSLYAALLSVIPVVIISLVDDIVPQSARRRIAVQLLSSLLALYFLGGVHTLHLGIVALEGFWLNGVALLMLLWFTNLFNFLDGLDGYAGSEALFVGLGAYALFGNMSALYLAAATAGFLLFNWHKASIFMGDVGSAPIGFMIAVLALYDGGSENFLGWMALFSLFLFDATVTLFRRFKKGEKLSVAHKKHMYQRLHQTGLSHSQVVLFLMMYNVAALLLLLLFVPQDYWIVFIVGNLILYIILKIVDRKKGFE
jgi:Fuc2NAc and GlcNAc transferase